MIRQPSNIATWRHVTRNKPTAWLHKAGSCKGLSSSRNCSFATAATDGTLGRRPHYYNGRIWKRSLNSTGWPAVHTNPSRKQSFSFCFRVDWKHFENEVFRSDCVSIIMWFPWPSFTKTQIQKRPALVAFLNFSGRMWTDNIWCVFIVKPLFSNSSRVE